MQFDFDARWHELAEEVISGMKEWRLQHPKASFGEIEQALDERLGKVRARFLQDAALASAAADIRAAQAEERPVCPKCGEVVRIDPETMIPEMNEADFVGYPMNSGSRLQKLAGPYG